MVPIFLAVTSEDGLMCEENKKRAFNNYEQEFSNNVMNSFGLVVSKDYEYLFPLHNMHFIKLRGKQRII